ncbi:hypothetical protein LMG29542_06080 [Paraburkholderia humisilvae]|uniref:Uncharacterized protein n=1 Tax=Paraburkholderia humisilvae TaxID=627669 RepID=A0A6J5EVR5_9BURK|nr:hypothetical protein LMG29542_06080 [Paraburkholderia humisilvae]
MGPMGCPTVTASVLRQMEWMRYRRCEAGASALLTAFSHGEVPGGFAPQKKIEEESKGPGLTSGDDEATTNATT